MNHVRSLLMLGFIAALAACDAGVDVNQQGAGNTSDATGPRTPMVIEAVARDVSPALRDMPVVPPSNVQRIHGVERIPRPLRPLIEDPVRQLPVAGPVTPAMPATSLDIEGIGVGFSGPQGTFSVGSAPPDTDGDVGPNHYVQIVNTSLAIFHKNGTVAYGPVATSTLWSGFGGGCQTNNDGDGVVRYDRLADRWVISQFSVSTTPYMQCIAVSTTSDPTGSYYRFAFQYGNTNFNDYPKMALWPDAYYFTFNLFANAQTFAGAQICAMDRAKMLTGAAATQQCFQTSASWGGLLASDFEGTTLPPSGSPNYVFGLGTNALGMWKFHVDWNTPSSSTFTGPTNIPVAAFSELCGGGTCISQPGASQQLDSLADRLMNRVPYRNFGDHEALLVAHAISSGSSGGMRWYEIRTPTSPTVFQQGTWAPDSNYRWMGSLAFDKAGDIALGYSVSSSSVSPSIRYTGRLTSDAAGTMGQGEGTIVNGGGSQGANLSRWGDYSAMNIDPIDDCTFWYTAEYMATTGTFNWHTRIASFKFPGCGGTTANDFSITATPSSATVTAGAAASYTVATAVTSGSAQSVALSVSGLPTSATATFNPTPVTAGSSSTLSVGTASTTPAGSYTLTITGTGASATHTAQVTLVVSGGTGGNIINGGFETGNLSGWSASGTALAISGGHSGSYAAQVGSTSPSTDSSISQTFTAPSGATTLSFWYQVHCPDTIYYDWASATLLDSTSGTTTTLLPNTCSNSGTWVQATASLTAGHSYTLTLSNHDDNYSGDPTYTLYDDVTIGTGGTTGGGVANGGFEAGTLSGWTSAGSTSISSTAHSGTHSAQVGSTSPSTDSSISQTFTVPSGATTLSFWYQVHCPDTITYDWASATLLDNTASTTTTMLQNTCTNNGTWVQATASVTAGHSYTLKLSNHDDNYTGDPTYTLYDDVQVQ